MPYKDPERGKQNKREYYAKNRERLKAQFHTYYLAHKEKWRDAKRKLKKLNHEKYLQYKREYRKGRKQRIRDFFVEHLGSKCSSCGFEDKRILEIHHIKGDPLRSKHRRRPINTLSWAELEKLLPDLTLLCPNCHALAHLDEVDGRIIYSKKPMGI
jgi:predicted HNH restriction endonuclease